MKRRRSLLMSSRLFLSAVRGALIIGSCMPFCANAVDGIAVGMSYRSSVTLTNISEYQGPGYYTGKIIRYVVKNDAVTSRDTIYKATWARRPVLSPDGSRVAFIRLDARTVGGQYQPGNRNVYISVMDTGGGNVRDIATFATPL
jgi:hypothetical protein